MQQESWADQMRADAMEHLGNPAACTLLPDKMAKEDAFALDWDPPKDWEEITLLHDAMLHSGQREESPNCGILRWGNYHLCKIFKDTGGEKGRNIS